LDEVLQNCGNSSFFLKELKSTFPGHVRHIGESGHRLPPGERLVHWSGNLLVVLIGRCVNGHLVKVHLAEVVVLVECVELPHQFLQIQVRILDNGFVVRLLLSRLFLGFSTGLLQDAIGHYYDILDFGCSQIVELVVSFLHCPCNFFLPVVQNLLLRFHKNSGSLLHLVAREMFHHRLFLPRGLLDLLQAVADHNLKLDLPIGDNVLKRSKDLIGCLLNHHLVDVVLLLLQVARVRPAPLLSLLNLGDGDLPDPPPVHHLGLAPHLAFQLVLD